MNDADAAADDPAAPSGIHSWIAGWRRLLLQASLLVYPFVTAAAGVAAYSEGAQAAVGYGLVAAFCCVYLGMVLLDDVRHRTTFWVLLGLLTVLFLAELPFARNMAFFSGVVVVSVLVIVLKERAIPFVVVGALSSLVVPWAVRSWHQSPGWGEATAMVFTCLTVYAFTEIAQTNMALVEARAEIEHLASEAERNRIARDLHDLLGHSLTAITVKAGLARRLSGSSFSRSVQEITEVEELSRQALTDVRAAVSGYRDVSLVGELARGRELLRASGVTAELPTASDVVGGEHQELFAWALREGLTNVARHARASRCTVTLTPFELEICDDGAGGSAGDGNGLAGLRERVAAAGGRVEAGPMTPRGWRLRVALGESAA